ncbi:MAG: NAD+ synthase [Myxococcales bacterium]|nr:NAD+ synthase [Myxococcales bacterium]
MRVRLCQINTTVVDFDGNLAAIERACERARVDGDQVVVVPELALTGYPPLDLLERDDVLAEAVRRIPALAHASRNGLTVVAGAALPVELPGGRRPAWNAAIVCHDGRHVGTVYKRLLPTYDVFDEDRWFEPGGADTVRTFDLHGRRIGITICEDLWSHVDDGPARYDADPCGDLAAAGADCILNLSASPFDLGKAERRLRLLRGLTARTGLPIAYCNLVGGNDSLLFDGRSFAIDGTGRVLGAAAAFVEADLRVVLPGAVRPGVAIAQGVPPGFAQEPAVEARAALVLGIRDYLRKCGFQKAIIGLSGGIDSALTAALAVEALGPAHVVGIAMPGPVSSPGSVTDALALADRLGIACPVVRIDATFDAVRQAVAPLSCDTPRTPWDVTDQNLQARIRGTILMAMSNATGAILLTTGNKSELAVGYCTLYGDMNGGLAVIGDLPKGLVYDVARSYNTNGREVIPVATLTKPPSAELAPDQKDADSLPPYPVLDAILERHVVELQAPAAIIAAGFDAATVHRVVRLVERAEYKRRQAAPVLRVTRKAFGGGRRVPMARRMP